MILSILCELHELGPSVVVLTARANIAPKRIASAHVDLQVD